MKTCSSWKTHLRHNFTKIDALLHFLELDEEKAKKCWNLPRFALNLPRRLAEKIEKNNLEDPLFLQFVPLNHEQIETPGFSVDPVEDKAFKKAPKLLHKYPARVLLLTTAACAMNCRFCFRQNFPYATYDKSFDQELAYIQNEPTIKEVILSGGDPLSLSTKTLGPLLKSLDAIDHVKILRFHSRFILGIPERITNALIDELSTLSSALVMTLHINHPRELDSDVITAIKKLKACGMSLLSQSVVLKGVNDSKQTLKELFFALVETGITPYYLHKLDPVRGAGHFETGMDQISQWLKELRDEMPGYSVPQFAHEIPHRSSKTLINI